jgi:hypothetical protein
MSTRSFVKFRYYETTPEGISDLSEPRGVQKL